MYYIYLLTHLPSGKFYVGKSTNPHKRFGLHFAHAWRTNTKLSKLMRETNPTEWKIEVLLSNLSSSEATEAEMTEIKDREAYTAGLNTSSGTRNPDHHVRSQEDLKRWATENGGPWNKGKKDIYSEETLKKMSEAKQGNTFAAEYHRDPEKQAAWLEKVKSFGKPVVCITTGEIFASVAEAASWVGAGRCDVRRVCNGKRSHIKNHVFAWYQD